MYDLTLFNLGEKIKNVRKSKGLTLEEFGEMIGKSKSTIYKYEENQVLPDFITLLDICNKLNITINKLCDFEALEEDITKATNPFKEEKLYLYYRGYTNKLLVSTIKLEELDNKIKVTFRNSYKDKNNTYVNEYIGVLESDKSVVFINLRNDYETTSQYEKIQIILDIKHSVDDKYIGCINATTDSNMPTTRKCILTKEKLYDRDELNYIFDKLKISPEELEEIKVNNYWNMPIIILEDYISEE